MQFIHFIRLLVPFPVPFDLLNPVPINVICYPFRLPLPVPIFSLSIHFPVPITCLVPLILCFLLFSVPFLCVFIIPVPFLVPISTFQCQFAKHSDPSANHSACHSQCQSSLVLVFSLGEHPPGALRGYKPVPVTLRGPCGAHLRDYSWGSTLRGPCGAQSRAGELG